MNWFTISLIVIAAISLVSILFHEFLTWRTPGRVVSQNAPMDNPDISSARYQHDISQGGLGGGLGSP